MAPSIITITVGGILILSAIRGISVIDVLRGVTGTSNTFGGGVKTGVGGNTSPVPSGKSGSWTAPPGGAASFKGPAADLLNELAGYAQNQFHLTITATTNGTHVPGSYHYRGEAFDASGSETNMAAFANFCMENFGAVLSELIHNPGYAIKDGVRVNGAVVYAAVWAGHRNHVHVASAINASAGRKNG